MGYTNKYTEEELQYLYTKEPELEPYYFNLDECIVLFLKTYHVFIEPCYDYHYTKQTQVQAWISWKQWALDHKKFETFKKSKLELCESHNKEVEEKFLNPEYLRKFDGWLKLGRSRTDGISKKSEDLFESFYNGRNIFE